MDFKVEGSWNTKKYCRPTVVADKESSRHPRMAKTLKFWPWWQPFNSFWFGTEARRKRRGAGGAKVDLLTIDTEGE